MALKQNRARLTGGGVDLLRRWVDGAAANTDIAVAGIKRTSQIVYAYEWDSATANVANDHSDAITITENGVIQIDADTTGNSIDLMFVNA